jgi:predicted hotdog family 3-hydroxylacyl-ACP dehydratase
MAATENIAALVPHQGRMCLLERLLSWDAGSVVAASRSHRNVANPLRSGGRLAAVHLCEYGAQAMALHGGLLARASGGGPADGLLVALRDVRLRVGRIDDLADELVVSAHRLQATAAGMQYRFEVRHRDCLIAEGRVAAMTRPA